MFKEIVAVYSKVVRSTQLTFCGQNAEFLNVKAVSENNHCSLEGSVSKTVMNSFPMNDRYCARPGKGGGGQSRIATPVVDILHSYASMPAPICLPVTSTLIDVILYLSILLH
jgi:hypothetical protein